MLKELIKLADEWDSKGLIKEADALDQLIKTHLLAGDAVAFSEPWWQSETDARWTPVVDDVDVEGHARSPRERDLVDWGQRALDVLGLVPIYGEPFDVLNAAISAIRGDPVGAVLSIISVIPIYGDAIGKGGKLLIYAINRGMKSVKWGAKAYTVSGLGIFLKDQIAKINESELKNVLDTADEKVGSPEGTLYAVYLKDIKSTINSAAQS